MKNGQNFDSGKVKISFSLDRNKRLTVTRIRLPSYTLEIYRNFGVKRTNETQIIIFVSWTTTIIVKNINDPLMMKKFNTDANDNARNIKMSLKSVIN